MKNSVGLSLPEYSFNNSHTAVIIGAGLAGCATAQALAKRGYTCKIYDHHISIAGATSALPAAVVRPAISGDDFLTSFNDCAFDLCCQSFDNSLFTQVGALELHPDNKAEVTNKNQIAFYSGQYKSEFLDASATSKRAGTALNCSATYIEKAGYINPQQLCEYWLQAATCEFHGATKIDQLRQTQHGWQLLSDTGAVIDESRIVILATANHTDHFAFTADLPLQKALGQIDLFAHNSSRPDNKLQHIINGNGYLLPVEAGVWSGATHHAVTVSASDTQADDIGLQAANKAAFGNHSISARDTQSNRSKAAAMLPAIANAKTPLASFAAIRTFTPDRLPIVGAVHNSAQYRERYADLQHGKPARHYPAPDFHRGLYLATGLGSRGATQALLIGELLADLISGNPQADGLGNQHYQRFLLSLHPARFLIRALRRGL